MIDDRRELVSGLFSCDTCCDTKTITRQSAYGVKATFACPDCSPLDSAVSNEAKLRRDARQTERDAHDLVLPRSGTQRARVLSQVRITGVFGATDEELATRLRLSLNTIRPRRLELIERGWLEDSGRTRRTQSGGNATVWVLTQRAQKALS